MPQDGIAWANRDVATGATHGMMVSILPYDLNDSAGIGVGKKV